MKEIDEVLVKVQFNEISVAEAMQSLSEKGFCPNLLNDDNGHWAVSFEGIQTVVIGDEPEDVQSSFFVEASKWRKDIREALIIALREDK